MNVATKLIATPDRHLARWAIAPLALLLLALSTVSWAQPTPEDSLPSVEELRHRLKLDVLEDRIANVRALARPRDKKAVAPLMAVLRTDSFLRVRWEAAKSLGAVGKPAVCSLIPILQTGKPDWSVDPALYALELIADPASAEAVLSVFLNSGRLRQVNAALALEQMPEAAVPLLTAGLTEGAWRNRVGCAHMLIDLRSTASGPAIVQLIQWLVTARDRVPKPPPKPEPKGGPTMELQVRPAGSLERILDRDTIGEMSGAATLLVAGLAQIDTATFDRLAEDDTTDRFTHWLKYRADDSTKYYARQRYFRRRLLSPSMRIADQAAASIAEPLLPVVSEDGTIRYLLASSFTDSAATALMHDLVSRYAESPTAVRRSLIRGLGEPGLDGRRDSSVIELFLQASRDTPLTLRRVGTYAILSTNVIEDARRLGYSPESIAVGVLKEVEEPVATAAGKLMETLADKGVFTVANTSLVASLRQVAGSIPSKELRQALVDKRLIGEGIQFAYWHGDIEEYDSLHHVLRAYPPTERPLAAYCLLGKLGDSWAARGLVEIAAAGGREGGRAIDALYGIDGPEVTLQLESIIKANPLTRPNSDGPKRFGLRKDTLARRLTFINGWRDVGGIDGLTLNELRTAGPEAMGKFISSIGGSPDSVFEPQMRVLESYGRRLTGTLKAILRAPQRPVYARGIVAAILAGYGNAEGKREVDRILDGDGWQREVLGAIRVLSRQQSGWAAGQLVAHRLDSIGKPNQKIYEALGQFNREEARTAAESDLVSPVPETRLAATQVLAKIGDTASFRKMAMIILDSVPHWAQPDFTDKPGVVASDFRFYERIRRSEMLKAMADIEPDSITPYILLETGSEANRRAFVPKALYEIVLKHHPNGLVRRLIELSNPDSPEAGGTFTTVEYAVLSLGAIEGDFVTEYLALRTKARKGAQDVAANWDRLLKKQDPELDFQLWESLNSESYTIKETVDTCITNGSPWLRARAERAARHPTALYRY